MAPRPHLYVLDKKHNPIPVDLEDDSVAKWGKWFEKNKNRIVKQENVEDWFVSTVFLAVDHNFTGEGPPVLFETMVFGMSDGDEMGQFTRRYTSWDAAAEGHRATVQNLKRYKRERSQ